MNQAELPRMLDDHHRLIARIGDGGMGEVYRGENVTLKREVAIKVMLPEDAERQDLRIRFAREAQAAARVRSAHVVEIYHFGETERGELYMVMELLNGTTLDTIMKQGPMHPWRAAGIIQQVCSALSAAHDHGVVHRDLKGANIMLIERDGTKDFVKLLDFGIAKLTDETTRELTATGVIVGTFTSMAPEQIKGGTIDERTDVYAIGVLLYRMLTARPPFSGQDAAALAYAHVHEKPPRPSVPGLAPSFIDIVMRCLEKDPDLRFPSMDALHRSLLEAGGMTEVMGSAADALTVAYDAGTVGASSVFTSSGSNTQSLEGDAPSAVDPASTIAFDPSSPDAAAPLDRPPSAPTVPAPGPLVVPTPKSGPSPIRIVAAGLGVFVLIVVVGVSAFLAGRGGDDEAKPPSTTSTTSTTSTVPPPVVVTSEPSPPPSPAVKSPEPAPSPTPVVEDPGPEPEDRPRRRRRRRRTSSSSSSSTATPKFQLQYEKDTEKK